MKVMESYANGSWKLAKRVGIAVAGGVVILVGIVLLPLPGPGWLIIFAGVGILAIEFAWARRLLKRAKDTGKGAWGWIRGKKHEHGQATEQTYQQPPS